MSVKRKVTVPVGRSGIADRLHISGKECYRLSPVHCSIAFTDPSNRHKCLAKDTSGRAEHGMQPAGSFLVISWGRAGLERARVREVLGRIRTMRKPFVILALALLGLSSLLGASRPP